MISIANLFLSLGNSPSLDPALYFQITANSPGVNNILNVTAAPGAPDSIMPGQTVTGQNMPFGAQIMPYGTSGTSGSGGTGTYALSVAVDNIVASETMYVTLSQFGQANNGDLYYDWDRNRLYNRNTANTAWNLIGSLTQPNFGLLPRSGGTLSSAMTGSNGLLTADGNTPFTAPPYVTSKQSCAATLADISNIQSALVSQINTQITESIQQIGVPGVRSNMAFGFGQIGLTGGGSIIYYPIPITGMTYADGTAVAQSDCYGFASISFWRAPGSGPAMVTHCESKVGSNGMSWAAYAANYLGGYYSYLMNYMVIAIKPSA